VTIMSTPREALNLNTVVRELAEQFATDASHVDRESSFPLANISALRRAGLMGLLVPNRYGGLGSSVRQLVEFGQLFGGACPSTAMLWAMHCQQVATLVRYGSRTFCDRTLPRIARGDCVIASVTTEHGKGGHLLTALAALKQADAEEYELEREAPIVSGGEHADAFLVTMRSRPERATNDVTLVFVERAQASVERVTGWAAMGMRGTGSVGLRLRSRVHADAFINGLGGFNPAAVTTMIPIGHLAWSAVWLGRARTAFEKIIALVRNPESRTTFAVHSELFASKLARVRMKLDTMSAYLYSCLDEYEILERESPADDQRYRDPSFQIHINNLKVFTAESAFTAINELVTLAGMRLGYQHDAPIGLEQAFRDLRSASLMYADDRLLIANGALSLLDRRVRLSHSHGNTGA